MRIGQQSADHLAWCLITIITKAAAYPDAAIVQQFAAQLPKLTRRRLLKSVRRYVRRHPRGGRAMIGRARHVLGLTDTEIGGDVGGGVFAVHRWTSGETAQRGRHHTQ